MRGAASRAIVARRLTLGSPDARPRPTRRATASPISRRPRRPQLIDATSGDQADEIRAVGEQAKLINAALPFSSGAAACRRGRSRSRGSDLDQRRALLCLTQAVYYEAGFEPIDGRRAVAQVVLNRMRHPAFPKSVCGVVYQGNAPPVCQFSFVCDGSLYRAPAAGAWQQAETVARAALAGYVERVGRRGDPLSRRLCRSALGADAGQDRQASAQHIFYRWPGAWGQPAAFTGRYIGEPRDPLALRPALPTHEPLPTDGRSAGCRTDRRRHRRSRARRMTSAACSTRRRAGRSTFPGRTKPAAAPPG